MQSAKLTDNVIVTNNQLGLFAPELNILWFATDDGVFKDLVSAPQARKGLDHGVCCDRARLAKFYVIFNDCIRPNPDIWREARPLANDCRLMDFHAQTGLIVHRKQQNRTGK
jgi:hypothetical protein